MLRPRPRIRPRGVMECWSVGVLRQVQIAPRDRGVGDAERVKDVCDGRFVFICVHLRLTDLPPLWGGCVFLNRYLGLKPQAESCCPFGAETECSRLSPKGIDDSNRFFISPMLDKFDRSRFL
jgi:hypothetical protein